ncbi:signal recognition particle-docking protein FtsY [Aminobacter aminovorans]|uniref:Signal recognition particle receptor FtsY n=1 Tax=Aminobacter aminovorans TaxID=83263 RepID=A0AAC8YKM6_AMIAI|nr:signal recognition particle-docking protein FtsY [Aminobacter aminovorans]AMS39893.1 Signal recognition particle receptor FtsY [Aminobacter aminovorans]MBB3707181.1 fused signal recognition particle receptor [Aminobacter aminovorans]
MAFGFIKKVFSFGKKEAVEQPAENGVLPPLNFDALEALKPAEEVPAAAETPVAGETPAVPIEEPTPEPAPETPPTPPVVPEPKPAEQPVPVEPGPQPVPQEEPAVEPEKPAEQPVPAPSPVEPEPTPAEVPLPQVEPSTPELPEEVPAQPVPSAPEPTMRAPETEPVVEEPVVEAPAPVPPEPVAEPRPVEPVDEEPAPIAAEAPVPVAMAAEEAQPVAALRDAVSKPAPVVVPAPAEPVQASSAPEPKPSAGKVTVQKKVEQKAEIVEVAAPAPRQSWFQRLRQGLSRSSKELSGNIAGIFTKRKLDEDTLQDLEDVLIRADLGVETALRVTDALAASRYGKDVSDHEVRSIMAVEVEKVLKPVALPLELDLSHKPHVILVVGVNGTGKTTTIGKLAAKLTEGGLSVMLAAGDTFRAAAIEQLKIWGERTKSPVIATKLGADAAGLAYDAFEQAKAAGSDVLIIDTAGRLQNKAELMAELEKIVRVLGKLDPEAPHTVLQTVDATTGQNALNQVEIFRNVAGVNGLVMTKLDGTARGGILVAIAAKHKLPVYFIGVGEQVDDLEPFSASDFAKAIAGVA